MKRYYFIDGLRGIAIILILIWHYLPRGSASPQWLTSSISIFWSGVDLFFVLSGFLIGGILLQNVKKKNYLFVFYIRRAARIMPLYLLVLGLFITVIYFKPKSLEETYSMHLPIWSYLTFTQNFFYAMRTNFNDPLIDVTWSLAIEEQFYIFLSICVSNLSKRNLSILVIGLILLAPVLRFFAENRLVAYCLPLHRADALMLGVLLAMVWQWAKGREFLKKKTPIFYCSFAILFLIIIHLTYRQTFVGDALGHFWLALFYGNALLLLLVVQTNHKTTFIPLDSRILIWFGLRSYGIYLFHKPLLFLIRILPDWYWNISLPPWIVIMICLIILFPFVEILHQLIEKPVMNWGHRFEYE